MCRHQWSCCCLVQRGLLPTIWGCKKDHRFRRPHKRGIAAVVSFPLDLYDLSTLEVPHARVSKCWGVSLNARVEIIFEVITFLV